MTDHDTFAKLAQDMREWMTMEMSTSVALLNYATRLDALALQQGSLLIAMFWARGQGIDDGVLDEIERKAAEIAAGDGKA